MDARYTAIHVEEDRQHWWFRGRLQIILAALDHALPARPLRLLELGCGSGNILSALRTYGEVVGIEAEPHLVALARAAGLDVRQGSVPDHRLVLAGWADGVLMLDVLEHLDDEIAALAMAHRALRERGRLLVTVPAYPWLWSGHDVLLHHRRRYTAASLRDVVERGGFRVLHLSYFNTLLFPAVVIQRVWKRIRRDESHDLRRPVAPVNRWLARAFSWERHVVPQHSLPFGASLLLTAEKVGADTRRLAWRDKAG